MKLLPAMALLLCLALGACADPYSDFADNGPPVRLANALFPLPERVYRGIYSAGFETNDFTPCGSKEGWWVGGERPVNAAAVEEAFTREDRRLGPDRHATRRIFVVWRGRPSHRGRYGHMGVSERGFHVSEVLLARPARPDDCRQ